MNPFKELFTSSIFSSAFDTFFSFTWLWLPILLGTIFFQSWIRYVRARYIKEQGSVLLELRLPKEILKSPAAMEIIINAMAQPSVGSYIDVYLKGRIRPWFSLEMVSLGGQVKFFIWTHKKFKNLLEAQIYSQFPTVEVHEVPDYTMDTQFDSETYSLWGTQLKLAKADAYPLKTYIDYGLDRDPKEEYKIDPLTPLIEYLGSLKPGDQVWIQILIQAHKKENMKDLRVTEKPDWKKDVEKEMKEIVAKQTLAGGENPDIKNLTDIQKEVIHSMQRNLGKTAFETMVRALYLAPKDVYSGGNIAGLTGGFKQFGSGALNALVPNLTTGFDYPWQDIFGTRDKTLKRKLFDAYRRRSFFHPPYRMFKGRPYILTTEELATIFHFPGEVASTPTLSRTTSKKGEAPSNLPI
jgi:hypothetical protein